MEIELERIQSAGNKYIPELLDLYQDAFPREERRDLNVLMDMLDEDPMSFRAVLCGSLPVGLLVYWEFAGFLYVEHLAVMPGHRGKGVGHQVLKILLQKGVPILLEVEIPYDEASSMRVDFYNRSGFSALPIDYFQPPYREGESVLPMMLFSDQVEWEPKSLMRCIKLFHEKVYNYSQKG